MNRRLVALLVGVLTVVLPAVALAAPGPVAVAAEPSARTAAAASVSGRVTDAAGRPVFGVAVTLWQADPYRFATARAATDHDGTYRFDDVASGRYQVHVDGAGSSLTKEWWPDAQVQASAQTFPVAEFQPRTGIDVALDPTATLTGRVVSAATGAGVAGATVNVVGTAPGRWGGDNDRETDRDVTRVETRADGTFSATGLQGGPYAVGAYDPSGDLVATWQDTRPDDEVSVPRSGSTSGAQVVMDDAAHVVGVAVDDDDRPIAGVRVRVHRDSTYWEGSTDSTGAFDVGGVLPGDAVVELDGFRVIDEWWRDAPTREEATVVHASAAGTPPLRAVLTLRSSVENAVISGTVRDQLGRPVVGAEVRTTEVYGRSDYTDDEGRYELTGLRAGSFYVHAAHPDHFYADSQQVAVAQGEHVVRDFTLTRGAVITGRLVDRAGRPVEGVSLTATDAGQGSGSSAADGSFAIRPVAPGRWAIRVGQGYTTVTSYWGTTGQTASTAQRVDVTGTAVVDIGTVVARAPARITGRITDTEGRPLARRSASLTSLDDDDIFVTTYVDGRTGSDGTYTLGGITPGRFRLTLWCGQLDPFQAVPAVAWTGDVVLTEGQTRRQDLVVALSAADETSRTRSCELASSGLPRVVGRPKAGAPLAVRVPGVTPSPAQVSVRWLLDGRRTRYTSRSLRVPRAWRGHQVRVRVVATRPDYQPLVLTSGRVRVR